MLYVYIYLFACVYFYLFAKGIELKNTISW